MKVETKYVLLKIYVIELHCLRHIFTITNIFWQKKKEEKNIILAFSYFAQQPQNYT